jgi:hypothetical protein
VTAATLSKTLPGSDGIFADHRLAVPRIVGSDSVRFAAGRMGGPPQRLLPEYDFRDRELMTGPPEVTA